MMLEGGVFVGIGVDGTGASAGGVRSCGGFDTGALGVVGMDMPGMSICCAVAGAAATSVEQSRSARDFTNAFPDALHPRRDAEGARCGKLAAAVLAGARVTAAASARAAAGALGLGRGFLAIVHSQSPFSFARSERIAI
jgi:hypothetical protein